MNDGEFEALAGRICAEILGLGATTFTSGPDGGRDARFEGTANRFPSETAPHSGKFIAQAKHTTNPIGTCSSGEFKTLLRREKGKVAALASNGELDHYLLFTNRKVPAGSEGDFRLFFQDVPGITSVHLLGREWIHLFLDGHPAVAGTLTHLALGRFQVDPSELAEVITAFHAQREGIATEFDSARTFNYSGMDRKNEINGLSAAMFHHIEQKSMPYFGRIAAFLRNPRNETLREYYHSTADEIKQKLLARREDFRQFDEALVAVYDLMTSASPQLRGKRHLVTVFLHYMYCDCDIGNHA